MTKRGRGGINYQNNAVSIKTSQTVNKESKIPIPFTCPQVMMNFGDEFLRKLGKEVFKQKEKKSKLKSKWHHLRGSQSLKKASIQGQLYV